MAAAGPRRRVNRAVWLGLALLAVPSVATAQAPDPITVSVPASSADLAVNRLAEQLGVSVVVALPLGGRHSAGLRGRYRVDAAFDRLLRPLGARAVRIGPDSYRVEPRAASRRPTLPAPRAPSDPSVAVTELDEVVVTASVRRGGLDGATGRILPDDEALRRAASRSSSEGLADLSATVDSTRQGPGRNKLFVRGVADSAVSGPLQATVGQYLGELRLNFGAPDPDIALVDLHRVEVFEGPQGSRFGAGSIGGVVRLEPVPPELDASYGAVALAASRPRYGAAGGDGALVVNRPIGPRGAWRLTAYGRRDGGVVDNPARGEDHADGVDVVGGRLAVRRLGDDWTLDGLALMQQISADDAPLVRDPDRLESDRPLAEPYASRLGLAGVTFSRRFGSARLTSATSLSRQSLDERFDATVSEAGLVQVVDRRQSVTAVSTETRLSVALAPRWSMDGGLSLARAETDVRRVRRPLAAGADPAETVSISRRFEEAALFGEVLFQPSARLSMSAGGRASIVRVNTRIDGGEASSPLEPGGPETLLTPAFGLRWSPTAAATLFARFEQGVRPGDVGEDRGFGRPYQADRITLAEIGLDAPSASGRWRAAASLGRIDWDDIQSDVVTHGGDLVTGNIGDGRIVFLSLRGEWRPTERLSLSGAAFANDSSLRSADVGLVAGPQGEMPNVAPVSGQASIGWGPVRLAGHALTLSGDFRYVGRSRPGVGLHLNMPQGGYLNGELSARLGDERRALVLSISNPLDVSATRFSVGSPYRLTDPHVVPVRPLTLRLGFEASF